METSAPPSFIPHDTVQTTGFSRRSAPIGGLADIFMVLAVVLCGASAAVGGGVFLYGQYTDTISASKLSQLQKAQAALDPSTIEQFIRLDDRMNVASSLIQSHIAPGVFFDVLGQSTLLTVSFSSLDVSVSDADQISIKMTGVAQSVNSIALQSELFGKNSVITNPLFSGISRQVDGVHFSFSASLKPGAIAYSKFIAGTTTPEQIPVTLPAQPTEPQSPFTKPGSATPPSGNQ